MRLLAESRIEEEFEGWDSDKIFVLDNGQRWQQTHYQYRYHYAYRPKAKVFSENGKHFLEVAGMPKPIEVHQAPAMSYLYDSSGNAVGFWKNKYVYALNGTPIGQISGTHVHKLSGSYVGELHKDMIVNMHLGNLGNIGNPGNPGSPGSPGNPGNRGALNYGFLDVFADLLK